VRAGKSVKILEPEMEILGNRNRGESQQLVSNPSNICSIRGGAAGEKGLSGVLRRAGDGAAAEIATVNFREFSFHAVRCIL